MSNQKTTKRSLGANILALFVCISMLVVATFAWFTDSASTSANKIQAGSLKVDIQDEIGNSLNGETLTWKTATTNARSTDQSILWEPGAQYELQPFKIVNKGDLDLKYQIKVSGIVGDAKLLEAIEFTVTSEVASTPETLNGYESVLAAGKETKLITITGKMKESAGNDYQGRFLDGIAITVVATQVVDDASYPAVDDKTLEDAILNAQPGDIVSLSDGTFTISAFAEGVTLTGNGSNTILNVEKTTINKDNVTLSGLTLNGGTVSGTNGALQITGNNTTLENIVYDNGNAGIAITVSTGANNTGTVFDNVTITSGFRGIQFWRLSGHSVIKNSYLEPSAYTFNVDDKEPDSTLEVSNTVLKGWTSYTSGIKLVSFNDCSFEQGNYNYCRPYSNTDFTNCNFSNGWKLNAGGTEAFTIKIDNCSYNGQAVTADNVMNFIDTSGFNPNATLIVNGTAVAVN